MKHTDIDIDILDRESILKHIEHVPASMIVDDIIKKHNVGIYLQPIPTFLDSGLAAIGYKEAGDYGFFKIDVLNNSVYEGIETEEELDKLIEQEPNWNLLQKVEIVQQLFQVANHFDMLVKWKPSSVEELAMFIAMIRPSKKYLMEANSWEVVKKDIWVKPEEGHYFKKSHSYAYAMALVVQLNNLQRTMH